MFTEFARLSIAKLISDTRIFGLKKYLLSSKPNTPNILDI